MRARRLTAVLLAVSLSLVFAAAAAAQAAKRPLSYDAYDSWKSIRGTTLSDDGAWLAYALEAQEDDGELVVRNLRTGAEFRHARQKSRVHLLFAVPFTDNRNDLFCGEIAHHLLDL